MAKNGQCLRTVVGALLFFTFCVRGTRLNHGFNESSVSIMRHYHGDIYTFGDSNSDCVCGPGSATVSVPGGGQCQCQCNSHKPAFKDDLHECTDKLQACDLVEYSSSRVPEYIPYVYIPLQGQLIHPTANIKLAGFKQMGRELESPVCVITKGQILTRKGWKDFTNSSAFEPPFRLFRDAKTARRTFLQWVGGASQRALMQGRIVLVRLICRDAAHARTPIFHPCVAFRVAGSPKTPVISSDKTSSFGFHLTARHAAAIALAAAGVVAAAAATAALLFRNYKNRPSAKLDVEAGPPKIPPPKSRRPPPLPPTRKPSNIHTSSEEDTEGSSRSKRTRRSKNEGLVGFTTAVVHDQVEGEQNEVDSISGEIEEIEDMMEEEDIYSVASEEEEEDGRRQRQERLLHEATKRLKQEKDDFASSPLGLSVVEMIDSSPSGAKSLGVVSPDDEGGECQTSAIQTASEEARKKLYFNPSYLDIDFLKSPPPNAVEFLDKIREMISAAKSKMRQKTFQPCLNDIPEEASSISSGISLSRLDSLEVTETIRKEINGSRENELPTIVVREERGVPEGSEDTSSSQHQHIGKEGKDNLGEEGESESASSTLKRIAKRVNSQGQSFVNEIIKTLDLKPRLPSNIYNRYPQNYLSHNLVSTSESKKNVNKTNLGETESAELVKPSMIRSILKQESPTKAEINNTFDTFRQEMKATLNKVKKVGETISPVSSLKRNKEKLNNTLSHNSSENRGKRPEDKVQKWLQTLETKSNPYSRMPESPTKTPNLPTRSASMKITNTESTDLVSLHSDLLTKNTPFLSVYKSPEFYVKNGPSVSRSKSWQNKRVAPNTLSVKVVTNDSNKNSKDNSITQLLTMAESKVPKIETTSTNTPPMKPIRRSVISENVADIHNSDVVYTDQTSDSCTDDTLKKSGDHSYEEIHFKNQAKYCEIKKINSTYIKEIHVGCDETDDEETKCSIYSNPDSLVSEIHIPGEKNNEAQLANRSTLSIEVCDNDSSDSEKENGKGKKKKKIKRNDSIVQDSLERPKIKKKLPEEQSNKELVSDVALSETSSDSQFLSNLVKTKDEHYSSSQNEFPKSASPSSKYLKTFKDYQEMRFTKGLSTTPNKSGITFNFKNASSHESGSSNDKPPLPPKQKSPKLPPKSISLPKIDVLSESKTSVTAPELPPKTKRSESFRENLTGLKLEWKSSLASSPEPPKLPAKNKKLNEGLHRSCSVGSLSKALTSTALVEINIPPKKPARKHSISLSKSLDSEINNNANTKEELYNFLDKGNIADLSQSSNVPSDSEITSTLNPSDDDWNTGKEESNETSGEYLSNSEAERFGNDMTEPLSSSSSEDRINGEFILSNNVHRGSSIRRQKSFSKDGKFWAKIHEFTSEMNEDAKLKVRSELEQYIKETTGSDDIKEHWRKILQKLDDSKENEKFTHKDIQRYLLMNIKPMKKSSSFKNYDSGYQSTDSSDSNKSRFNAFKLGDNSSLKRANSMSFCTKIRSNSSNLLQPSVLRQILPDSDTNGVDLKSLKKREFLSLGKNRKSAKLSLYINDSFTLDG